MKPAAKYVAEAAHQLAELLENGTDTTRLSGRDQLVAVDARDQILVAIRTLYGNQFRTGQRDLLWFDTDLRASLQEQRTHNLSGLSPTDLYQDPPTSAATRAWMGAAHHLELAATTRPGADDMARRPRVQIAAHAADLSSLVVAVSTLDNHLCASLQMNRSAHSATTIDRIRAGQDDMYVAALSAWEYAKQRVVDSQWEFTSLRPQPPVTVPRPEALPEALSRTVNFVSDSSALPVRQLLTVNRELGRTATLLSTGMELRPHLQNHVRYFADALLDVQEHLRRVQVHPTTLPNRALGVQLEVVTKFLEQHQHTWRMVPAPTATVNHLVAAAAWLAPAATAVADNMRTALDTGALWHLNTGIRADEDRWIRTAGITLQTAAEELTAHLGQPTPPTASSDNAEREPAHVVLTRAMNLSRREPLEPPPRVSAPAPTAGRSR